MKKIFVIFVAVFALFGAGAVSAGESTFVKGVNYDAELKIAFKGDVNRPSVVVTTTKSDRDVPKKVSICGKQAVVAVVEPQKLTKKQIQQFDARATLAPFVKLTSQQVLNLNSFKNGMIGTFSKSFSVKENKFIPCQMAKKESNSNPQRRVAGHTSQKTQKTKGSM